MKDTRRERELILQELQRRGFRVTRQRRFLIDFILNSQCHSCKEIVYGVNKVDPSIGSATVYRMVNLLESIGVFDKQGQYCVSFPSHCEMEQACTVELDDDTTCYLSATEWNAVLRAGLTQMGYVTTQDIRNVEVRSCQRNCEPTTTEEEYKVSGNAG